MKWNYYLIFCLLIVSYFGLNAQSRWTEIAKALPTEKHEQFYWEKFGFSVDIDGDYAVIGAPYYLNIGRAIVLHFDGTEWKQIAELHPFDTTSCYVFGFSVGISGDNVVIRAIGKKDSTLLGFVFTKPVGGWKDTTETAKLFNSVEEIVYPYSSQSAAIYGNTIVIGEKSLASAFVFTKPEGGWKDTTETAILSTNRGDDYDNFGWSVSIWKNEIVVSAHYDSSQHGAIYVYTKPEDGWKDTTETAKLVRDEETHGPAHLGIDVDIDSNTIVAGAVNWTDNFNYDGEVYVFTKPEGGWKDTTEVAILTVSDYYSIFFLGYCVSISGDNIVTTNYNQSFVYTKPSGGWKDTITETAVLSVSYNSDYDYSAVAISGDNIITGPFSIYNDYDYIGEVNIFTKPEEGWKDTTASFKILPPIYIGNCYDYFGNAVDIDSDYVVVGSYGYGREKYEGIAYVLHSDGRQWQQEAVLKPSDSTQQINFSHHSVAISGNTIVIGAYADSLYHGAVYVYEKPADGWTNMTETAKLMASDEDDNDNFGYSVDVYENIIVVGAKNDDDKGSNSGSAYVFERPDTGWSNNMTETAKLTASDGDENDNFGCAVSIWDSTIVVGAEQDDIGSKINTGSAYVFKQPNTGWSNMTETAKLTESDYDSKDYFGHSVSISDSVIVVGAYGNDDRGYVYVYEKPSNGWHNMTEIAKLRASSYNDNPYEDKDHFGYSVSISKDTVIVGDYRRNDKGINSGAAYIFTKPSNGWISTTETLKLLASDGEQGDNFGASVSVSGTCAIVGATLNSQKDLHAGAAYLFKYLKILMDTIDTAICKHTLYTFADGSEGYVWGNMSHTSILTASTGNDSLVIENITSLPKNDVTLSGTTITANASGLEYQWLNCDSNMLPIAGAIDQSFTALHNGHYAVEITQNTCVDTSICIYVTAVGLKEISIINQVNIYPNPTNNQVIVELGNLTDVSVDVYDFTGKTIYCQDNIHDSVLQLPLEQSGIYFIKITANHKTQSFKVIKE